MSSKEKRNSAILANFVPCRHDDKTKHILTKKLQNQSILGPNSFGMQLQTFPKKCNMRKFQPEA